MLELRFFLFFCFLAFCLGDDYSFRLTDERGDEEGVYPRGAEFDGESGLFDLLSFQVDTESSNSLLLFSFEFEKLTNPRNGTFGFTYPLIQLYIHTKPPGSWRVHQQKSSSSSTLGNNGVLIDNRYTWDRMLHVTGWNASFLLPDYSQLENSPTVETEENTIKVTVDNHPFGIPNEQWSYTLLIGSFNFSSSGINDSFRIFQNQATEEAFGGGENSSVDPNVVDILTAPNAALTQQHILYSYCEDTQSPVVVPPVSNNGIPYIQSSVVPSTLTREVGGIGCIDSVYQTSPQLRYEVDSEESSNQWKLRFVSDDSDLQQYGPDEKVLLVTVEEVSKCIFRIVIQDAKQERFQLPFVRDSQNPRNCSNQQYNWSIHDSPFSIKVTRTETGEEIFNSKPGGSAGSFRNLVFKDKYIEFSTRLPDETDIFGLGERRSALKLDKNNKIYSIFNIDQGTPVDRNLYGSHPFFMEMRENNAHGVFMANSFGMDVVITNNRLTYKITGGIIDMYIFLGPSVEEVAKQFHSIIGLPALPPYWSLGYHQSRWGYSNVEDLQEVVEQFEEKKLPIDTFWSDIDYMDDHKLWTLDPVNYSSSKMREFVDDLHESNKQYVLIIDPGVKQESGYAPYEDGLDADIFIKDSSGQEAFVGKVWPGFVSFVDFYHPNASGYWTENMASFYHEIPFDGLWIDMNEIASFCDGHCKLSDTIEDINGGDSLFECLCTEPEYDFLDFPPYFVGGHAPDAGTISMAAMHYGDIPEYNLHNLYGYMEAKATKTTLEKLHHSRSFVLSRSTFSGSGHHSAHWLGDNTATWEDMKDSIAGIVNMNLFGIPFVGADVCGFNGNTTSELCARWMQLGAFYPFYRNHNGIGFDSQEPYVFGNSITDISRKALSVRYSMITYYYSKLIEINDSGGMLINSLGFVFPLDSISRSLDTQFMVGDSLMIAPVLTPGSLEHSVYFPFANWFNYFTGEIIIRNVVLANQTDSSQGKWIEFDNVHMEDMFVFIKGGSVVFSQVPAMNSKETKDNPISIIVALSSFENETSSGTLLIDDGESLDSLRSEWNVEAVLGDDAVGVINFNLIEANYTIDNLMIHNITVYGVPPPCTIVLFNGNTEVAFVYDSQLRTLVITLDSQHNDFYQSFYILWGEAIGKQPFVERFSILTGSLMFTVSVLSIISLLLFGCKKKYPNCKPPSWLHIPHVREIPEYRPTTEDELIETEMDVFELGDEEQLIQDEDAEQI